MRTTIALLCSLSVLLLAASSCAPETEYAQAEEYVPGTKR